LQINEALKLERRDFKKRMQLRQKKAHDYATDYDVLSNFKLMANLIETYILPQVFLVLSHKHILASHRYILEAWGQKSLGFAPQASTPPH